METCIVNTAEYNDGVWIVDAVFEDANGTRRGTAVFAAPESATTEELAELYAQQYRVA